MRTRLFFMLAFSFLVLAACNKSSNSGNCNFTPTNAVAPAAEIAVLKAALDASYTQHPSGIFYKITTPGAGITAEVCSDVTVKYLGSLINGTPFDSSYQRSPNGATFTLGQLILGWQIGIPLIKKGGSIILYIPPSLGYGASGGGAAIPPNSNLVFTIDLVNVQ